ncbi:MAG: hypothetical protein HKO75_02635 [Flavobacteriaceae bacterium]|nr:hypothetical protein [Muriicola sp.]NNC61448.1 hypothetical protein [Eudoraea sp.]NNK20349.1 hypothetical protein [Flavobacteriaceae bacterium]MBT8290974.1 hypothetical protein [Muriicola sp.]NNK36170.1 hypothetical protein [Eudoraea sp.]
MDESTRLFGARICTGLLLITVATLVILAYQEYSAELAREAEFYIASSLNQFDTTLAVK